MRMDISVITSRKNPEVMYAASLLSKKGRCLENAFIAEGIKLFREAVQSQARILRVYIAESRKQELLPVVLEETGSDCCREARIFLLSDGAFEKISSENAPQGIVTVIKSLDNHEKKIIIDKKEFLSSNDEMILALSSVRDPGNLGAIIRSAVAFGFSRLVLSDDCAELQNPKTVRAAMGAIFKLSVTSVSEFSSLFSSAREAGRRVLCAELTPHAMPIDAARLSRRDIIVIGNEGHGIAPELSALADGSVYLPIAPNTESLNAAVAASVFLWEISRKE